MIFYFMVEILFFKVIRLLIRTLRKIGLFGKKNPIESNALNRSNSRDFSLIAHLLVDPEVTANLYCNFAYLYWEGCVICSLYLR